MPVTRQIKTVTVEFTDGTVRTFTLPPEAGYLREDYTWEASKEEVTGIRKWTNRLKTFQIFWAEKET